MLTAPSVRPHVRSATVDDLEAIRRIYDEGIQSRIATLEVSPKLVLFTFSFNDAGRALYAKFGRREVGTFKE